MSMTAVIESRSGRYMRSAKVCVTVAALLLAAGVTAQPEPDGAPSGFPGASPAGGPPGAGAPQALPPAMKLPSDDGIPPPNGRAEEDGTPELFKPAKLSDRAPKPPREPRNFEGTWAHRGLFQYRIVRDITGGRLPYTDAAKQILKHRREMENAGKPLSNASARCYPTLTWNFEINAPFRIVQSKDFIYFVFQEFHAIWQVRMNQTHRTSGPREYNGDSVGHWDGDTLVVDTINFKDPLWLDASGTPTSKDVRLTHRIRKIEGDRALSITTEIDDPQMYTRPWSFARAFAWAPNSFMLGEYNCEQQVGGAQGVASYGLFEDDAGSQQAPPGK